MTFESEIKKISGLSFHPLEDLTSYTTMRLKSIGDLLIVNNKSALKESLRIIKKFDRDYFVIGWGANLILPPVNKALIIHLDFSFDLSELNDVKEEYILPASLGLNHLTSHAVKFNLVGWDVFTGIPASLGGAVYMNAGTNLGEIGSLIKSVLVITRSGEEKEIILNEKSFSYRKNHFLSEGDIIVEVVMKNLGSDSSVCERIKAYLELRRKTQPLATKNCGCVFKNPGKKLQAGRLVDQIGLKGLSFGGLVISPKHANFIENRDLSDWYQFSTLTETVKFYMDHFYGIEFELEVKIPYHN